MKAHGTYLFGWLAGLMAALSLGALCACGDGNGGEGDADAVEDAGQPDALDARDESDQVTLDAVEGEDIPQDIPREEAPPDAGDAVDVLPDTPPPPPTDMVDILLVIDNSGTMAAEQNVLRSALPELLSQLLDPDDPGREPLRDLHIGVVSTDMGTAGYSVTTCTADPDAGDDGVLQNTPHGTGCDPTYPPFLTYSIPETEDPDPADINDLAADFGCIGMLGTNGCGFEQQLEAAYKALTVHSLPGGANEGFLREDSVLVIMFITDENDCSVADPELFDLSDVPYSINLRCFYESEMLHPLDRYAVEFTNLRDYPEHLIVSAIVGVPPGSVCNGWGNEIAGCLGLAGMQETVQPDGELLNYACLYPAGCTPPDPPYAGDCSTEAFPGRRFVELAQTLGSSARVDSICAESYSTTMSSISERIGWIMGP